MFDIGLLLTHVALVLRIFVSTLEPVLFTIHALSVYLFAIALLLLTCIILFVVHWKSGPVESVDEVDTPQDAEIPIKINRYEWHPIDKEEEPTFEDFRESYEEEPMNTSVPYNVVQPEVRMNYRGYYQPVTPLPAGFDMPLNQHRFSQYDNIGPNQNSNFTYLRNSDLI